MSRARRKTAKTAKTMADYAMPLEKLDLWLRARAKLSEHAPRRLPPCRASFAT